MKRSLHIGLALAALMVAASSQVIPTASGATTAPDEGAAGKTPLLLAQQSPAAPGAAEAAAFPNTASVKALVFLKSRDDLKTDGLTDVTGLVIRDMPILQTPAFEKLITPYLGQPMNEDTMKRLQREVILHYRNNDRPLVDVLYPEQEVTGGVLQIVVIEARLKAVRVQDRSGAPYTNGWLKADTLREYVRLKEGEPISQKVLAKDLDWLSRNPFRTVQALYEPSGEIGQSDLILRADVRRPFSIYGGIENTGTPSTGENRLKMGFDWGQAFGFQDHMLNLEYTDDVELKYTRAISGNYVIPMPWRNSLRLVGAFVDSKGDLGNGLIQQGTTYIGLLRYEVPLPFIGRFQHEASFGMDFKSTDNSLEFSNNPSVDTPTDIFQLALGYSGVLPDKWGVTSVTLQGYYSPGGVTDKNSDVYFEEAQPGAEAEYAYGRFGIQRRTSLPWDMQWVLSGTYQIATGNLLPIEKLGMGGYSTIRGYEERYANGDEGWLLSNELRSPALHPARWVGLGSLSDELRFLAFADFGSVYNKDLSQLEDPHYDLQSVGFGFRYTISRHFTARFDYGWPLVDVYPSEEVDSRAHFSVILSY